LPQKIIMIPINRLLCVVLLTLTVSVATQSQLSAQTSSGDLGLGIIVGEPTGISGKMFMGGNTALDFGAAWSFGKNASLHLHADYLIHRFDLIEVDRGRLPFYYGIGGRLRLADDAQVGIRIPVGLSYYLENDPLEIFFEIVPVLDLTPGTGFSGNGGFGVRYYFGQVNR
jgi:hypothetical protein